VNNVWGIIKMIFELIKTKEDGKFVLLKDPNKPTMRLYSVPINAFDDEEGEGEGEGEGEEGEGEEAVEGFETEGVPITPAATEDA
jgi:translation initiation factor 3 subunit D